LGQAETIHQTLSQGTLDGPQVEANSFDEIIGELNHGASDIFDFSGSLNQDPEQVQVGAPLASSEFDQHTHLGDLPAETEQNIRLDMQNNMMAEDWHGEQNDMVQQSGFIPTDFDDWLNGPQVQPDHASSLGHILEQSMHTEAVGKGQSALMFLGLGDSIHLDPALDLIDQQQLGSQMPASSHHISQQRAYQHAGVDAYSNHSSADPAVPRQGAESTKFSPQVLYNQQAELNLQHQYEQRHLQVQENAESSRHGPPRHRASNGNAHVHENIATLTYGEPGHTPENSPPSPSPLATSPPLIAPDYNIRPLQLKMERKDKESKLSWKQYKYTAKGAKPPALITSPFPEYMQPPTEPEMFLPEEIEWENCNPIQITEWKAMAPHKRDLMKDYILPRLNNRPGVPKDHPMSTEEKAKRDRLDRNTLSMREQRFRQDCGMLMGDHKIGKKEKGASKDGDKKVPHQVKQVFEKVNAPQLLHVSVLVSFLVLAVLTFL
jgi:hypothetical protein